MPANWAAPIAVGDASVHMTGLGELQLAPVVQGRRHACGRSRGHRARAPPATWHRAARVASPEHGKRPVGLAGRRARRAVLPRRGGLQRLAGAPGGAAGSAWARSAWPTTRRPLRGPITAFAGYGAHCAYAALYNASRETASLQQFGAWLPVGRGGRPGPRGRREQRFVEAWHGALCDWTGGARPSGSPRSLPRRTPTWWAPPRTPAATGATRCCWWATPTAPTATCACPRDGAEPVQRADAHLDPDDFADPEAATSSCPAHSLMAARRHQNLLDVRGDGAGAGRLPAGGGARTAWTPRGPPRATPTRATWRCTAALTAPGAARPVPDDTFGKIISVREYHVADDPPAGDPLEASYAQLATPVVATLTLREQVRPAFRLEYAFTGAGARPGGPPGRRVRPQDGAPGARPAGPGGAGPGARHADPERRVGQPFRG